MYGTSMRENREIPPSPRLLITGWAAQGTRGGTTGQGRAVHRAAAPCHGVSAPAGVLGDQPEGRAGGGLGDVGRLWTEPGGESAGSAWSGAVGGLPGEAESAGVHPETCRSLAA